MERFRWSDPLHLTLSLVVILSFSSCVSEGEDRVVLSAPSQDPCEDFDPTAGLSSGADFQLFFGCLNKEGQLDWMAPLVDTLATTPALAGGSLLDAWVEKLGSGGQMDPRQLGTGAKDLQAQLESGATELKLRTMSQGIEDGVWSAGLRFLSVVAREIRSLPGDQRDAWRASLQRMMCHSEDPGSFCQSPLRDHARGKAEILLAHPPGSPDYPLNSDLDNRNKVDWIFYAGGDLERATRSNQHLVEAFAQMALPQPELGEKTVWQHLFTRTLPDLYGDDLDTPYFYEGYPSHNTAQSALYGLMLASGDVVVRQAVVDAKPESYRLLTTHFPMDLRTVGESGQAVDGCAAAELPNPELRHAVGQLLRILEASNYDIDDPALPERCGWGVDLMLPWLHQMYELSGSRNLAVIVMEVFSQLPAEQAQDGADLLNHESIVDVINGMCQLGLSYEDTEALQVVVYMQANLTYGQAYLSAFSQASQLETVTNFLAALERSGAWCGMTDLARLFDDPLSPSPVPPEIDPTLPQLGGGPEAHDKVTQPMLTTVMDFALEAPHLLPPVEAALREVEGQQSLADLLTAMGRLAHRDDSALLQASTLDYAAAQVDTTGASIPRAAALLNDGPLVDLLLETLASPEVIITLTQPSPQTGISVLDGLQKKLDDGELLSTLNAVANLLGSLETSTNNL